MTECYEDTILIGDLRCVMEECQFEKLKMWILHKGWNIDDKIFESREIQKIQKTGIHGLNFEFFVMFARGIIKSMENPPSVALCTKDAISFDCAFIFPSDRAVCDEWRPEKGKLFFVGTTALLTHDLMKLRGLSNIDEAFSKSKASVSIRALGIDQTTMIADCKKAIALFSRLIDLLGDLKVPMSFGLKIKTERPTSRGENGSHINGL